MLTMMGAVGLFMASSPQAAPVEMVDEADTQILDAYLKHVESSSAYCTPDRMAQFAEQPEDITWQGALYIKMPLIAYELTEETRYLDMFVERMDALIGCIETGPDGYKGWYGVALELFRHPDHPDAEVDVLLTSFFVSGLMADCAVLARADDGLNATCGEAASRYLALATDHLVAKWDARGCYRELGDGGAVYTTNAALKPTKGSLTQPHNKHSKIIKSLLSLYKATGNDEYVVKASHLGTRYKRSLTLVGDRYSWHYWDPAGAWDINPDDTGAWKHWIGAEHRDGYYNLTLSMAVLLYEHGLLFDRADIDRFLRTQMDVCWNGDTETPVFKRVDGEDTDKAYVCSALAPFDDRIYEMVCGAPAQTERLSRKDHSWGGGPSAMGYLEFKYITYPKWKSGDPAEADSLAPFLAKPKNQKLLDDLTFTIDDANYSAPRTPAEMENMPGR
ncbi:MAG TPA: hypothetical protein QGH10_18725 [Armatimonadota bacterium]|nr:hypothetical protein [Armatimonadota bacterium]